MANDIGIRIGLEGIAAYNRGLDQIEANTTQTFDKASRSADGVARSFSDLARELPIIGDGIAFISNPVGALITGLTGAGAAISSFVNSAAEFETVSIQFETLIGDAERAKQTLEQLTNFAATTPFRLDSVTDAGRKLLAFGIDAEDLEGTLRRLGDISAGVGAPLEDLADIYGKIRVQGRLFAEDINQLTGRGIPVIQELANQFGVAESEVKKLVEEGKVGFPEIEEAFRTLTDEGGQFEGLTENLSQSFEGLRSTLGDAFQGFARDIGGLLLPVAKEAVQIAIDLVNGFGQLPEILSDNAEFIGIAAGALIAWNATTLLAAAQSVPALIQSVIASTRAFAANAASSNIAVAAQAIYITGTQLLRGTITAATAAQRIFNVVFNANPIALIGTAIAAAAAAFAIFGDEAEEAADVSRDFSGVQDQIAKGFAKEKAALDALFAPLRDNTASQEERSKAIQAINRQYGEYLPALLDETSSVQDLALAYKAANAEIINNVVNKAIAQEAERITADIVKAQIESAKRLRDIRESVNDAEIQARSIEFATAFEGGQIEVLRKDLETLEVVGQEAAQKLQTALDGIDLTQFFGATSEAISTTGSGIDSTSDKVETLAEKLASLGVSLPEIERLEGLSEITDQTEEVRQGIDAARASIVTFSTDSDASISELDGKIRDLNQAIELLPPSAVGIEVIVQELVRLEDQADEARERIEALRNGIGAIDPIVIPFEANVQDLVIPPLPPIEQEVRVNLAIDTPEIGESTLVSLIEASEILGVNFDFLNDRFRDTSELLAVMESDAFQFGQALSGSVEGGIVFVELLGQAVDQFVNQSMTNLLDGFAQLGVGLADVVQGTQTLGGAFDQFGRETLAAVIESGTRIAGMYLMQYSLSAGPAGLPIFLAGLALAGLSGFVPELLLDQSNSATDVAVPSFGDVTGGFSGPSLATGTASEATAIGLSDVGANTAQATYITVQFDGEDVSDSFSMFFQRESELTGVRTVGNLPTVQKAESPEGLSDHQ